MNPKIILFLAFSFSLPFGESGVRLFAQLQVVNNGIQVAIKDINVAIDGNFQHQNNGTFNNTGHLYLTGNWTNNNANNVFTTNLGGWVHLKGSNQNITGNNLTLFNKLELTGTGVKLLTGVDATVEDTLALNDRELATDSNTLFVTGTGTNLITRTSGFVSSTSNGGLSRNTNSVGSYMFPVGTSVPVVKYRPVDIKPSTSSSHTFKVRMANTDATTEGFNRNTKDSSVCDINSAYYHRIERTAGTATADVTIYFNVAADGNFQTIVHWQNMPRWESTGNNSTLSSPPLTGLTANAWNNFLLPAFAFATVPPVVSISDVTVCERSNAEFIAPPGFANYDFSVNNSSVQSGANNKYSSGTLSDGAQVRVSVYNSATCKGYSNTALVKVNAAPTVNAGNDTVINIGETANLSATGNAGSYIWRNSDGTLCSSCPSVTLSTPGTYIYYVEGTNAKACSNVDTVVVKVEERYEVFVPNIFSPNGDGKNDKLQVYGKGISWIVLSIFDRWGEKVFEADGVNIAWDGTFNGKDMNTTVFAYFLKGQFLNGQDINEQGNITLLR